LGEGDPSALSKVQDWATLGVCTSALVGVGLAIMDSSMFVATITGLPRFLHPCTMRLCQYGTCTWRHADEPELYQDDFRSHTIHELLCNEGEH
jgi:hypothetical protein